MTDSDKKTSDHIRLLLLRHGEVSSHRGDVPITREGYRTALAVGRNLAHESGGSMLVLSGQTERARQTASAIAEGARSMGVALSGPRVSFALRNPDIYLGGDRVDMVSTAAAFVEQIEGVSETQVESIPFFREFISSRDRIGWWLRQSNPPGEDGAAIVKRIETFARSLADLDAPASHLTVAVTHSPILRACARAVLGEDPGEPEWVSGLEVRVYPDQTVQMNWQGKTH